MPSVVATAQLLSLEIDNAVRRKTRFDELAGEVGRGGLGLSLGLSCLGLSVLLAPSDHLLALPFGEGLVRDGVELLLRQANDNVLVVGIVRPVADPTQNHGLGDVAAGLKRLRTPRELRPAQETAVRFRAPLELSLPADYVTHSHISKTSCGVGGCVNVGVLRGLWNSSHFSAYSTTGNSKPSTASK